MYFNVYAFTAEVEIMSCLGCPGERQDNKCINKTILIEVLRSIHWGLQRGQQHFLLLHFRISKSRFLHLRETCLEAGILLQGGIGFPD